MELDKVNTSIGSVRGAADLVKQWANTVFLRLVLCEVWPKGKNDRVVIGTTRALTELPTASFFDRIAAMVEREQRTRYAGGPLGYFWAFAGPIAWIAYVVVFFRVIGRNPPMLVGVEIFVATGILPYALFRQNIASVMRTVIANRQMTAFHPINNHELVIATSVLEFSTNLMTASVIFGVFAILFEVPLPASLPKVLLSLYATWVLGVGVGALFACVGQVSDSFHRGVQIVMRPLFWISGLFFTATELPESAIALFWWNPLFHCIELLREGFFLGFDSPIASLWYPIVFGTACFLISLPIMSFVEKYRLARHTI
jgi:capsular polysaccharide transport system permease protein